MENIMNLPVFDATKCVGDLLCVTDCPVRILDFDRKKKVPFIVEEKEGHCISCGHCEAICPHQAVTMSEGQEAARPASGANLPNKAQIEQLIKGRRSIRLYKEQPVERTLLSEIFDLTRYAPTAKNTQLLKWLVIDDPALIKALKKEVIAWAVDRQAAEDPRDKMLGFGGLIQAWEKREDPIFRNAPDLVIVYTPELYRQGIIDGTIAAATFELAASAKGIGACWAGYFMIAMNEWQPLQELLALPKGYKMTCALMAGYPRVTYRNIPTRKGADITWR